MTITSTTVLPSEPEEGPLPQIRVEYSEDLADAFDRRAFALDLHRAVVETAGARLPACKSKFLRLDGTVVGDGTARTVVHVEIALFTGRSEEARVELGRRTVELLAKHVAAPAGLSAEVREIDRTHYHKGEA